LRLKLPIGFADFLTTLAAVLNAPTRLPEFEKFSIWREAQPQPLE